MIHGRRHHDRQRLGTVIMIATGLIRVAIWATMIALYAVGVHAIRHLYSEVQFVTILSVLALLLTDWGQVAASMAALAAGRAHEDAEQTRQTVSTDYARVDRDIAELAELSPGPDAQELAAEIRRRLGRDPGEIGNTTSQGW